MTEQQYRCKKRRAEEKQRDRLRRQEIRAIKHPPKPKMETSKKMAIYIHIMCTVVILYSLVAMWYFQDLSHLDTLIAGVVAASVNYITYCAKAFFAKKCAEEVKLKRDLENVTDSTEDFGIDFRPEEEIQQEESI